MNKRISGLAIIILGAFLSIISLAADQLGFGSGPNVVGWKQLTGAAIGFYIAIFGLWLSQAHNEPKSNEVKDEQPKEQTKAGKVVLK